MRNDQTSGDLRRSGKPRAEAVDHWPDFIDVARWLEPEEAVDLYRQTFGQEPAGADPASWEAICEAGLRFGPEAAATEYLWQFYPEERPRIEEEHKRWDRFESDGKNHGAATAVRNFHSPI